MRISELSRRTGVSIPTIKYYLREELLPPGYPKARNQAEYGERHLRRIWLIRTFTTVGGLDLSSVRKLIQVIEDERLPLAAVYRMLDRTISRPPLEPPCPDSVAQARDQVDRLMEQLAWRPLDDSSGATTLVHVLAALRTLGCESDLAFLQPYAKAAAALADAELDLLVSDGGEPDRGAAVVRGVLLDVASAALRRMAHEQQVLVRLPDAAG
ncbi:MerR family transcriptional regulator [Micromonospora sp. NPDC051227]|uniref:MerR family transcriptional regulator n=1 Tax=Micromonospora sp. NPDC051227 TaxID=3364285 RepID=UPI001932FD0F|nr:MerR family transcriptional regulator [Micromonospora sp. STR1s_5]